MGEVLSFAKPEPDHQHISGETICIGCRERAVAVAPVGVKWMECHNCRTMKSLFVQPVGAAEGDLEFLCDCGCEALTAYKHDGRFYLRCMSCGTDHTNAVFGD